MADIRAWVNEPFHRPTYSTGPLMGPLMPNVAEIRDYSYRGGLGLGTAHPVTERVRGTRALFSFPHRFITVRGTVAVCGASRRTHTLASMLQTGLCSGTWRCRPTVNAKRDQHFPNYFQNAHWTTNPCSLSCFLHSCSARASLPGAADAPAEARTPSARRGSCGRI